MLEPQQDLHQDSVDFGGPLGRTDRVLEEYGASSRYRLKWEVHGKLTSVLGTTPRHTMRIFSLGPKAHFRNLITIC